MSNYSGEFTLGSVNNAWNMVFDMIHNKSTVLDVGCSGGDFGEALNAYKECLVDGIEPDKGDAERAGERLRRVIPRTLEDAINAKEVNEEYDHIVFLDVIEHLVDPIETLKSSKTILKDSGTVLFSIPNMAHVSVRLMLMKGGFVYGKTGLLDHTHLHFYTKDEIHRIFAAAGFSITELQGVELQYTDGILKEQLRNIGISSITKELKKELLGPSSRTFQYVGCASKNMGEEKKCDIPEYSPDPQGIFAEWYENKYKAQQEQIEYLQQKLQQVKHQAGDQEAVSMTLLDKINSRLKRTRNNGK